VATDAKQSGDDVPTAGRRSTAAEPPIARMDSSSQRADLEMLHRRARAGLEQALLTGEQVLLVIPGLLSAAIVATDRRAFVFKTGARAGLPFSARLKEFEYETVMRVDLRPADQVDVVVIHAPLKISTCSSYWADPRDDHWKARNAIAVTRGSALATAAAGELSRLVAGFNDRGAARRSQRALGPGRSTEQTPDVVGHISERAANPACVRCGSELGSGWQYCPRCGAAATAGRRDRIASQRRRRQPGRSS
jgi:hypothetical protein